MATIDIAGFDKTSAALRHANLAQAMYDEGGIIMDDVLLTLHGAAHHARRTLEFRVFRRNFFHYYEKEVFPRTLRETIAVALQAGRADLVDLGYRVTINLTSDFAGIDRPQRTQDETDVLMHLVKTFSEGATLVHSTRVKDEVRQEVRDALEVFDRRFLQPSIARRRAELRRLSRGEISEDDLPRDVLTTLLQDEDRVPLSPDLIRREIAFYMQAGAHSTANATTHSMHEIFMWRYAHPEDRDRLRDDPLFVQRCVHESLRLHPASPEARRKPVCPFALDPATLLTEEDRVVLDFEAANRDTSVFGPDADQFNPHRSLARGQLPFGLSFGSGIHSCLGRDLDAGVVPRPGADPTTHQYGIVPLLVLHLLAEGARPDPDDPPTAATYTKRKNWGRYPVVFDPNLRGLP